MKPYGMYKNKACSCCNWTTGGPIQVRRRLKKKARQSAKKELTQ